MTRFPGSVLRSDRGGSVLLGLLAALALIVPVLNLAVPESSGLHLSTYTVALLGKYLTYAVLAVAVDLVWGYCGILSLGHAAFFALGGYAIGMYLMREIGARGVYGNPLLPDFMVFLNWKELPWYWHGFDMFWFAALMVIVVPGLLALAFGWLAFRSRVTGVYLSIITQALTYALMLAFFRNDMGFGGNNGFTDFKDVLGFDLHKSSTRVALFLLTVVALAGAYVGCRYIVASRAGRVIQAVRDAESRARFIGYRVESYKLWVWVASAVLAGIAGALYVPQVGIINPSEFSPVNSIEVVIWVAVGGRGTLYGAVAGAVIVNYFKSYFTSALPELWLYALGALFVLVTLFLPRGVVGALTARRKRGSGVSVQVAGGAG
ncbi:MAG TPA: urea ABC transporter permease subunit UrtC [Steroidobacteraceae bacterium]